MSQLLLFLAIAILFLALLLFWSLRTGRSAASGRSVMEAQEVLAALELELSPRALAERIFSTQDWDFVSSQTPTEIRGAFLLERRKVALSWLRHTRKQAARLMNFHRRAVRGNINISPIVEIKLAANYLVFLVIYAVLAGLISMGGPIRARRLAGSVTGQAEQLWSVSRELLTNLDAARLGKIKAVWAKRSATS